MIFSIDTVSSDKEGRELPGVFLVPFSAYSRNRFNPATPIDEVRLRSIISDLKVEKIIILIPGTGYGYISVAFLRRSGLTDRNSC